MKKYVVYSSVGDTSVHKNWFECKERLFDIVLCYYGNNDEYYNTLKKLESDSCIVYRKKGLKWPNFREYCKTIDIYKYSHFFKNFLQTNNVSGFKLSFSCNKSPVIAIILLLLYSFVFSKKEYNFSNTSSNSSCLVSGRI